MNYDKAYLDKLITDKIEENTRLDYKGRDSLDRKNPKKLAEMTKDVSSFANSAGGKIIYGIREFDGADLKNLPEKIEGVDKREYSPDWLAQIVSQIQPPIEGLEIIPVHVGPEVFHYCYVIDIPQSGTAHQAADKRYHRRRNTTTEAMEDYEIRDVMNRRKFAKVKAEIRISVDNIGGQVDVRIKNRSNVMARHFAVIIEFPEVVRKRAVKFQSGYLHSEDGKKCWSITITNEGKQPLFPYAYLTYSLTFKWEFHRPDVKGSEEILLGAYADNAERVEFRCEFDKACEGWV